MEAGDGLKSMKSINQPYQQSHQSHKLCHLPRVGHMHSGFPLRSATAPNRTAKKLKKESRVQLKLYAPRYDQERLFKRVKLSLKLS